MQGYRYGRACLGYYNFARIQPSELKFCKRRGMYTAGAVHVVKCAWLRVAGLIEVAKGRENVGQFHRPRAHAAGQEVVTKAGDIRLSYWRPTPKRPIGSST